MMAENRAITRCRCGILAAILLLSASASAGNDTEPTANLDFSIRDLDGKKIRLKELLNNGPVLLDFWALWCIPCLKELPKIQEIRDRYHSRGLTVVAINEDAPSDQSRVKPYIKRKRFHFRVVPDEDKELWYRFKVISLPTTLLLDTGGNIVYSHTGYKPGDEAEIAAQIERLLPKKTESRKQ